MDLNKNGLMFSCNGEHTKGTCGDTMLRLDCFGYGASVGAGFGSVQLKPRDKLVPSSAPDDSCRLVLGLGPTPSKYCDDHSPGRVNKGKVLAATLNQGLSSDGDSILKLGPSGGADEISGISNYSVSTQCNSDTSHHPSQASLDSSKLMIPLVDEGSTSAKKSGGYMPTILFAPRVDISSISETASAGTSTDGRTNIPKKCKYEGCSKGARGATGLCIGHGGGQRCQKPGCSKGAESRTAYCKFHGGGKRCQHLGCTKSAEGKTDHCIAHGGGRRCGHPGGCTKAARGKSGLCIRHGGGKRCKMEGCTRSAEGQVGLCISHGGGRRCQSLGCSKGAQGSTMYCKAHGGGKRCIFAGCTKGAEGSTPLCKGHGGGKRCLFDGGGICPKSVHGGTNFCVVHGGGKRCTVPGCTKSARGRTDCCVKHGGGKRCKFENCGKSAQGSTNLCKAHGGGKRCNWGEGKCEKFARGKNGLCAAHSSMAQDRQANRGGMIGLGLFHGLVPAASSVRSSLENTHSSSGVSVISDSIDSMERPAKRRHLIPPQVLVPLSMKSSLSSYSRPLNSENQGERSAGAGPEGSVGGSNGSMRKGINFAVPEGRVHGGGLMSLLGGNLRNAIDGI